jgi:hypothetical protein
VQHGGLDFAGAGLPGSWFARAGGC